MRRSSLGRQAGITLIEALVSLGVMAFGILGIAGIQATLRTNSDVAKQRAEAVRIAQRLLEDHRGFQLLNPDGTNPSFNGITTESPAPVTGLNATFSRQITVSDAPVGRMKNLTAKVTWTDRLGETQSVVLGSSITGNTPELSGSLGLAAPGGAQRQPGKRHLGVPRQAVDQLDGTSRFDVPGGDGRYWVFSNSTGVILVRCRSDLDDDCNDDAALLLTGFVRFATSSSQPSSADAEIPSSPVISELQVRLDQTAPTAHIRDRRCFEDRTTYVGAIEYFCAAPITDDEQRWSGRSYVDDIALASSVNDADSDKFRVCRYTTVLSDALVGTGTPVLRNADHPASYLNVEGALTNQNFLVIRAGNDSDAFTCPDDDTTTPFVYGRTFRHQPNS